MDYKKVVWISLDALRADCIGPVRRKLYDKEYRVRTPLKRSKLDEICEKSFLFTDTISVAPYTSTSHASYFTGLWPKNHGLYDQFNHPLRKGVRTIFQLAKDNGFKTLFKTDSPFILGKYLGLTRGVDAYYAGDDTHLIDEIKKNGRMFAFIHFAKFHYPYGFHSLEFGGDDYLRKIEELERKHSILAGKPNFEDMATETFRTEEDLELLFRYKKIIAHLYSRREDDALFNLYLEGINYFNEKFLNKFLSDLLAALEGEDYLLIISSDHGEGWNDETYGHHNSVDEGLTRVLLAFHAPDIPPGKHQNRVRTIDVFPTIAEMVFNAHPSVDGATLAPLMRGGVAEESRPAFSAVWVTDLAELVRKAHSIVRQDRITTRRDASVRYSAAAYLGEYKCEVSYKHFVARGQALADANSTKLYRIASATDIRPAVNGAMKRKLVALIGNLNAVGTKALPKAVKGK